MARATAAAALSSCCTRSTLIAGSAHGSEQRDAAFDLAALLRARQPFPQRRLERAQLIRHLDGDVEVAVIDRAQLDSKRDARHLGRSSRESRHAEDHRERRAAGAGIEGNSGFT
jgi:hypothetical protein